MPQIELIMQIGSFVLSVIAFISILIFLVHYAKRDGKISEEEKQEIISVSRALLDLVNTKLPNIPTNAVFKELKLIAKQEKKKPAKKIPEKEIY